MGYTHYWTQRKNITALDWQDMQAAYIRILAKAKEEGLRICGPDGMGSPEFGSEFLAFNGDETQDCSYEYTYNGETRTYKQDAAHESFVINRKRQRRPAPYEKTWRFTFCKTDRKPYDAVVTAIGCYLETAWPEYFEFTSDGNAAEWQDGLALACRAIPEKGNQMQIPGWVQDGERWLDHGIRGKRYALKKHVVQGWVIVNQTKPLIAPEMSIPEDEAIRAAQQFKSGSWRGNERERKQQRTISSLMRLYSPETIAWRERLAADNERLLAVWQQFKSIADQQPEQVAA